MSEAFDLYKAPQFVDFKNEEYFDDSADAYFDVDHENSEMFNHSDEPTLKAEQTNFLSPSEDVFQDNQGKDPLANSYEEAHGKLRKSMSVGNLILFSEQTNLQKNDNEDVQLCENMKSMKVETRNKQLNKFPLRQSSNVKKSINNNLKKPTSVRTSAPKLYRPMSRENLDRLAQPKRYNSVENLNATSKFVSMAESIIQFQNRTPKRFRSKPDLIPRKASQPLQRTVPQSPALQTKMLAKNRFQTRIPSYEEREQMEFEKEQKFKIKANPVNKKILSGPLKPTVPVVKKPSTVPEPFHLTEIAPKKPQTPPKKYEFHAQPMPRYSVEKPRKIEIKATEPITPSFMKHYKKEMVKKHQSEEATNHQNDTSGKLLQPTKPQPFSFEQRDRQISKRKEQLLQKYIEEEKRAREFHAKPVPKCVLKRSESSRNNSASSLGSSRTKSQENLLQAPFRARPPTVLYKEPFIPQKSEKPCVDVQPFALSTESRAYEREEFEREKKQKEARLEILKKMEELKQKEKEQEEIARIRKEAEVKAHPVRKYKEVLIVPSQKVTMPISPKFETDRLRNEKRRENKENLSSNISA